MKVSCEWNERRCSSMMSVARAAWSPMDRHNEYDPQKYGNNPKHVFPRDTCTQTLMDQNTAPFAAKEQVARVKRATYARMQTCWNPPRRSPTIWLCWTWWKSWEKLIYFTGRPCFTAASKRDIHEHSITPWRTDAYYTQTHSYWSLTGLNTNKYWGLKMHWMYSRRFLFEVQFDRSVHFV